jgi:SEC-C motif-containing protein
MGSKDKSAADCPCGSGIALDLCCRPYLDGESRAPTAEALMRSRYSAYALGRADYLRSTWHSETRPSRVRLDPEQRWIGLSIKATEAGLESDSAGVVEFVARFKVAGRGHRLHERSRFERIEGQWYYRDGNHL